MNINKQLKGEHNELKHFLKQIEVTSSRAVKKRDSLFQDFKLALLVHSKVEEAVFYSRFKSYRPLATNELEAENEHRGVAGLLLEELNTMPKDNPEWMAKFMMLKEMLEHHIEEEEQEIFKKAKCTRYMRVRSGDELAEDLGNTMRDRSQAVKAALEPVHVRH